MFKLVILKQVVDLDYSPIEGYMVSNKGQIYSKISNKYLKNRIDKKGYNNVCFKGKRFWKVSRIVALAFPEICGEYFEGAEADHINGIRNDNRPDNLRWVSHKENVNNPITIERMRKRPVWVHSEEWKIKVSEKNKNKDHSYRKTPIIMDEKIIFEGITDAAKYFGLRSVSVIHRVLTGERKSHKGHTFKYYSIVK